MTKDDDDLMYNIRKRFATYASNVPQWNRIKECLFDCGSVERRDQLRQCISGPIANTRMFHLRAAPVLMRHIQKLFPDKLGATFGCLIVKKVRKNNFEKKKSLAKKKNSLFFLKNNSFVLKIICFFCL